MTIGHLRHTLQLLSKPALLNKIRDVAVYAPDMYGIAYGVQAAPTVGILLNDPYWSFSATADQGISTMVKVPNDRVMGTNIKFYLEFGIPTAPGGGTIMWQLDWLVRGINNIYFVAPATSFLPTVTGSTYRITTTAKLAIPAYHIDYQQALGQPVEFFLGIIRVGTAAGDTETSAADLHKLIMEYTAYY